ncbi:MSMEG_1061 family FMN-dependent PPOX-type flavoprotein [uncultured Comamonas sp.]|uniref:MSMEG_1061 family FMN-dependent PPOX-type flavoprotein n=1 Tax=uncultured Comamonas sp. TaxID=114710 RepID=UPI0025FE62C8|nr:MSMEG_1061 family FMN-dependent PPOX-type flavoprotein [uncultured Comamonas sp.]
MLQTQTPNPQAELDGLYAPPSERIQSAVLEHLVDFHRQYLRQARFFCLATAGPAGLDASPRGGPPGFVRVLDDRTLAFADWPGNNRIESMRNLQHDERVAMLFLFPGLEVFLRINGHARVSVAAELLQELREGEKTPKAATVVRIDEVLFHCGKAVNRARLWEPAAQPQRCGLPSVGQMLAGFAALQTGPAATHGESASIDELDAHYVQAVRSDLYG